MDKFNVNEEGGRIAELATVAALKFKNAEKSEEYLDEKQKDLKGKTPRELASESIEGLMTALKHLSNMELKL